MALQQVIYSTAVSDGMPELLAKFIVSQAQHETDNFTSGLTQDNNLFGYSFVPGGKWQLSSPSAITENGRLNARYSSPENSVHEITDWIKRRQREHKFPENLNEITTPYEYAWYLKNSDYYGAPLSTYADRLEYWYSNLPPLAVAAGGASIILIGLAIYLFSKEGYH